MDKKHERNAPGEAPVDETAPAAAKPQGAPRKLSEAAKRALAEAEARRAEIDRKQKEAAKEVNGRGGLDPVRYGDWEVKGMTSDF